MSAVLTSPEDVINAVLQRIGYPQRIGSIYEGTRPAKVALDVYGQTRDQMLRDGDWGFARRDLGLTLLKSAPTNGFYAAPWTNAYPPLPWLYEYTYPTDCLKVRAVRQTPAFIPDFDPKSNIFDTPNDNSYTPAVKVIVCNLSNAVATYTGQITNPTTWEASFTEGLIADLGRRFSAALATPEVEKIEASDEQAEVGIANVTQG